MLCIVVSIASVRNSIYLVMFQKAELNVRAGNYSKEVLNLIEKNILTRVIQNKMDFLEKSIIPWHWLHISRGCMANDHRFCHVGLEQAQLTNVYGPWQIWTLTLQVHTSPPLAAKRRISSILLLNWKEQMRSRNTSFLFVLEKFIINIHLVRKGKAGLFIYVQF